MEKFIKAINARYPLPPESLERFVAIFEPVTLPKKAQVIRKGYIENHIYFLDRGVVRAYLVGEDGETTIWFGVDDGFFISFNSYAYKTPGYENIELLEDSSLYVADVDRLRVLFATDIAIANWGRAFAEDELVRCEQRLIAHQVFTAEERYRNLIDTQPEVVRRVPLRHIASYLGITQVSLSRIRAKVKR